LDVAHPELPALMELMGVPYPLIHQMGYYLDVEQLPDGPCLRNHQMGYYLDVGLLDAVHRDAVQPNLKYLM